MIWEGGVGTITNTRREHSGNRLEPIGNKEKLEKFFIKKPENFCKKNVATFGILFTKIKFGGSLLSFFYCFATKMVDN
jgi:hypothetical protein